MSEEIHAGEILEISDGKKLISNNRFIVFETKIPRVYNYGIISE
jgi:hypothetical protein